MNMNDLKNRNLRMPDDMTCDLENLIEKKVGYLPEYDKQNNSGKITYLNAASEAAGRTSRRSGRRSWRSFLVFGLAAALACGGVVSAAVISRMQAQKKGNYGQEITFYPETTVGTEGSQSGMVTCTFGYLPDGMTAQFYGGKAELLKDGKTDGSLSAALFGVDSAETMSVLEGNVDSSESFDADGHEGLYISQTDLEGSTGNQSSGFRQKAYVYFPEAQAAVMLYAENDLPKDQVLKIAKNIKIAPAQDGEDGITLLDPYLILADTESSTEDVDASASGASDDSTDVGTETEGTTFPAKKPGDQTSVEILAYDADGNALTELVSLDAVLSNVNVYDDLSPVPENDQSSDQFGVDGPLSDLLGDDGKLKADTISYVKSGDGIDTKDTVVDTDQAALKFVTVDLTYTNNTAKDLTNVLFYADAAYLNADGSDYIAPKESDGSWDSALRALSKSEEGSEMAWENVADTSGQNNGSNYFDSIKAGESRTVIIGFLADEDQLSHMVVNVGGEGSGEDGMYSLGLS